MRHTSRFPVASRKATLVLRSNEFLRAFGLPLTFNDEIGKRLRQAFWGSSSRRGIHAAGFGLADNKDVVDPHDEIQLSQVPWIVGVGIIDVLEYEVRLNHP